MLAHFSDDKDLKEAYANNRDLYATVASGTYNKSYWECMEHWEDGSPNPEGKVLRSNIKQLVLGISYGMGAASIALRTGQTTEQAQSMIDSFYDSYPAVRKWKESRLKFAEDNGYSVTLCGRRRRLPELQLPEYQVISNNKGSDNTPLFDVIMKDESGELIDYYTEKFANCKTKKKARELTELAQKDGLQVINNTGKIAGAKRQAINSSIQGSAADISKLAMIEIYNNQELKELGFDMLFVVHDEIAGQCPRENAERVAELIKECMIGAASKVCSVKMKVDTYTISRWYFDDLSDTIKKDYDTLIKGNEKKGIKPVSKEEAFNIIDKNNQEIDKDVLRQMCEGTLDLSIGKFARSTI